jgi:short-subunit dehydrogenase
VQAFAREGARLGLIARGKAGLEGAQRDVERLGSEAIMLPTDVAVAEQVEAAANEVENRLGPIDVWVNVAMTSVFSPVKETTAEEFRRVTEVNYLGFVYGTLAALRRMLPRDRGTIIQVGSALAYRGIPLQSAYCGSKHAIQGFMDSLRCELIHDRSNVRTCMVQMPALNTPQFSWVKSRLPRKPQPVPPIYQPEVAARAIVYASHHPRREMFVGLPTVQAILGNRIFPGLLDKYLARTGYDSQQHDGAADPDRRFNLWEPVDAEQDHGAHGSFDQRATDSAPELWASMHRRWICGGLIGLAAIGLTNWLNRKALS